MISRRDLLAAGASAAAGSMLPRGLWARPSSDLITKTIPSSGEVVPVIGLGTRNYRAAPGEDRTPFRQTVAAFLDGGGKVVDTAPSYGNSEEILGENFAELKARDRVFLAGKVDRTARDAGIEGMNRSLAALGTDRVELMQVHNLTDTATQLATLREWKAAGRIRYIGISTSSDRQYEELERLVRTEKLDFIQVDYAVDERGAGERLLPAAAAAGTAVLINLPFGRGRLFQRVGDRPLPDWAKEFGVASWAQFFLKYVVSHPAVTCAITGMTKPHHAVDNLGACRGVLPDVAMRKRMETFVDGL
jgi:aryl-alcohol dehydrogenase-like predicted oxidoreductase